MCGYWVGLRIDNGSFLKTNETQTFYLILSRLELQSKKKHSRLSYKLVVTLVSTEHSKINMTFFTFIMFALPYWILGQKHLWSILLFLI